MIMLNLFIGIVMNSMAEMHVELDERKQDRDKAQRSVPAPALDQLVAIERQLAELRVTLGGERRGG